MNHDDALAGALLKIRSYDIPGEKLLYYSDKGSLSSISLAEIVTIAINEYLQYRGA